MTVDEIFSELAAHMIKGIMIHDQMSSYYDFLSLCGYQKCHEYHYWCENASYLKLKHHYFKYHNKLIKEKEIENPNLILKSWYNYTRSDVDISTKRNAVKSGLEKWVDWERETKLLYEKMYKELVDLNEINDAKLLEDLICDVAHELSQAEAEYFNIKASDFDIEYILMEQCEKKEKFKAKMKGDWK